MKEVIPGGWFGLDYIKLEELIVEPQGALGRER